MINFPDPKADYFDDYFEKAYKNFECSWLSLTCLKQSKLVIVKHAGSHSKLKIKNMMKPLTNMYVDPTNMN